MLRALAILIGLLAAAPVRAQPVGTQPVGTQNDADRYPSRAVQLITLTTAGGALDVLARFIAQGLQEETGQPFVVVNRTGAGGNIGGAEIARATPDGTTIGMATVSTHGINPTLYANMPFDPVRDFTPILLAADLNIVVLVNPAVPASNVAQLVAYAKANPGRLSFGSAGTGTALHMTGEMLKRAAGIDMIHVPYQGTSRALPDLLSGQIQLTFANPTDTLNLVRNGQLRAIGVAAKTREATLPEVATLGEQGYPDVVASTWFGVAGPAGLPKPIVDKLHAGISKVLRKPGSSDRLAQLGMNLIVSSPSEFGDFIESEIARWAPIVRASKAKVE